MRHAREVVPASVARWRCGTGVALRNKRVAQVERVAKPRSELLTKGSKDTHGGRDSIRRKEARRVAFDSCRRELGECTQRYGCLRMEEVFEVGELMGGLLLRHILVRRQALRIHVDGAEGCGGDQE